MHTLISPPDTYTCVCMDITTQTFARSGVGSKSGLNCQYCRLSSLRAREGGEDSRLRPAPKAIIHRHNRLPFLYSVGAFFYERYFFNKKIHVTSDTQETPHDQRESILPHWTTSCSKTSSGCRVFFPRDRNASAHETKRNERGEEGS